MSKSFKLPCRSLVGYDLWDFRELNPPEWLSSVDLNIYLLWYWRRFLRVPWTTRRSNPSILKEINPEYSLEGLGLKLKFQYFGHLIKGDDPLEKTLMLGKIEGKRREGWQRMRWLDSITDSIQWHKFEQTLGDSEGQGSLVCYSPWGFAKNQIQLVTEQQQGLGSEFGETISLELNISQKSCFFQIHSYFLYSDSHHLLFSWYCEMISWWIYKTSSGSQTEIGKNVTTRAESCPLKCKHQGNADVRSQTINFIKLLTPPLSVHSSHCARALIL